jgi:hypothetical protein
LMSLLSSWSHDQPEFAGNLETCSDPRIEGLKMGRGIRDRPSFRLPLSPSGLLSVEVTPDGSEDSD